jgi:cobalt-zinc-cadmium efflux system outer membrane protein
MAIIALSGAALLGPAGPSAAEDTLAALMRRTLAQNAEVGAARAQVAAAMGRLVQAGLWPNPRLGLSNENGVDASYARSIGITQEFPIAGRIGRSQDVARVDVARALAEVNEAERQLIGRLVSTYYAVVALNQKLAVTDRLIAVQKSLVDASSARSKAGEVSALDVNAATLEFERLSQQRKVLAAERIAKLRMLGGLVGLDPQSLLDIKAVSLPIVRLPSVSVLTQQALERRPDLRLLELSAHRAAAEQALARASAWEDWSVSVGVRRDKIVVEGASPQTPDNSLMLSLSVPLPLFNRNQGTLDVAAADELTARQRAAALILRIKNEVAGEYEQAIILLQVATQFKTRDLPLAEHTAALARDAYNKGQLSMSELVQIEREEISINSSYLDTLAQYLAVLASLRLATAADAQVMTHLEQRGNVR